MDTIILLVLMIVLLLIELATVSLTTIWFSAGALVACIVSIFTDNVWVETIILIVVSVITLVLLRPSALKHFNSNRIKTNCDSLIGTKAFVTEKIDNKKLTGAAIINGQEWTARALDDEDTFDINEQVEVVKISGVKLIVKAYKKNKKEEKGE
jgi:membrane protein implicated in regulation of membrane protease activity